MEIKIEKSQEFIILSKDVTNATRCIVTNIPDSETFDVELVSDERYKQDEDVELFTVSGSGVLYFGTKLENADGRKLTIKFPKNSSLIQRREYTRVEIRKNILIYTDAKTIRATIIDISAGGMCIVSDTKMDKNISYQTDINLEKNLFVSCKFKPVRVVPAEDNKFKVSGQFKLIKNIDRVALAQYCLKKIAETEQQ